MIFHPLTPHSFFFSSYNLFKASSGVRKKNPPSIPPLLKWEMARNPLLRPKSVIATPPASSLARTVYSTPPAG
jgi:hypothetical protein